VWSMNTSSKGRGSCTGGDDDLRVLIVTNQWPREHRPYLGVMVVRQVESLSRVGVGTEVFAINGTLRSYATTALRVWLLNFGKRRYDLVHAHTGHSGVVAVWQWRYPVVLSYVGYDIDIPAEHWEGVRTKTERFVFVQLSRFIAATITKSRRGRNHLPRAALARNTVLPNGVDRELFDTMPREEARRRLGWPLEGPVVLFAADPRRFQKRYQLAADTLELVRQSRPDVRLEICNTVMPNDVPLWMNAADVLLLTSIGEGSPNVVKEAMACDLPVVSVEVGDVREVIEGSRHCHVCAAEASALAAAVLDVVAALPERSDGRARTAHLGIDEVAQRLRAVYDDAINRGPGLLGFLRRPRSARCSAARPATGSAVAAGAPRNARVSS
jgi:teichuronic acid biosynthesis glycosyltransferase TuaC